MKYLLLVFLTLTGLGAASQHLIVTNGHDGGAGSLRQALLDARDGAVISFQHVSNVDLTSGQLVISKNITLEGAGVTIRGKFAPLIKTEKAKQIILKQINFWEDNVNPKGVLLNLTAGLRLQGCAIHSPLSKQSSVQGRTKIISTVDQPGVLYPGAESVGFELVSTPGTGGDTEGDACQTNVYRDADGDGLGDPIGPSISCVPLAGYVSNADDCDDNHPNGSIVYVNTAVIGGNNDGSSWANAYNDLQDALAFAGTCTNITQIWVAKGTYYPDEGGGNTNNDRNASFQMRNNLAIYGGFASTETLLGQRNWKINKTILSGDIDKNDGPAFANNAGNSYHVLRCGGDNTAVLDGLWVTGGNANGQLPVNPDPSDLLATGDYVPGEGGGMFNSGSPTVVNCSFFGNWASAGGAIATVFAAPLIANSSFSGNMADKSGGALYFNQAEPTVTNCSFSGNVANSTGGGMYVSAAPGYASLQLINCSFSGNTGGALFANDTPLPITNCIFWGNSSEISSFIFNNGPTVTYSIVKGGYSGTGNLNVDPLFVDAASGNLHLKSGSPAINSGNDAANSQPTDLDGNARKNGVIDMGAYEFAVACPSGNILYVNAAASGNNDGTSWSNAYTKLQDALANTCAGINQIWVAKGTYYPDEGGGKTNNDMQAAFSMKKNLAIYGGFAGTETSLSQRNWKTNKTVLSGDIDQNDGSGFINNDNNAAHVIYNNGLDNTAIIDGFVIEGGNANNAQGTTPVGGGMDNVNSSVMINNCTISGNSAIDGGGIFNANSSISMSNCAFLGNSGGGSGGAMYNGQSSGPALVSCEFFGNSGSEGGAIFNSDGGGVFLVNCTVSGNTASDGGGLYCLEGGSATVINSIFWGNSSEFVFTSGFFGGSPLAVSYSIVKGGFPGTGNLDVDPLFVDQANGDLHLTACSPAIDAGDDASNDRATDLDGNARMINAKAGGAIIDMGAFEYRGTLPSATLTGSKSVCLSSPTATLTLTASGGTPPYTYNVTSGGIGFSLRGDAGNNSLDVAIRTDIATQYTYNLLSVYDNSTSSCPQLIDGQTATVIVNPLPTATIAGSTSVCKGGSKPSITFSGSGGTPLYTFTYTLFDGTNTTTSNVTGNPASLPVETSIAGTYTYTLVSVKDAGTTACSQVINGQSAVVTVNPLPDATIITAGSVTAASSGNVASVPDAGLGATYLWTITNGTITAGLGTASVTYKAGNSGSVTLNVSVKSGSGCGPIPGSVIVAITPLPCPNPAISVTSFVCSGTTGNKASVANAGTGAKYVWTIVNGTITGGSGTSQISFTAGINKYADYGSDDFVKLSVKVTDASGVCTEPSGTYKVFISPIPSATIITSTTVCSKSGNNCASVPFAGLGAKYSWTITNGTITSGTGTRGITYTAGTSGSIILAVTVTNYNGCSSSSGNKSITIAGLPVANISASSTTCGGSGGNTASVTTGPSGTKYCWSISNGCITSGSSASSISYTAGSSGSVTLSVTVTNSSGCNTYSGNKVVTISSTPNATITASSVACAGSTGNSASVPSAGSGASYQWTVTGGTITSGSGTNSVKFTAGSSGYVTLNITIANSNGCKKSSSKKITIAANVIPTFSQIGPLCKGSKAPSLPTKSTNGITGSWSPSTISTSSATTTTYTFTPAAGQCASTTKMQIKVQTCSGTVAKSVATEEVTGEAMDAKLLQNPAHSQFTVMIRGTRKEPAEIRVFDMLGRSLDHFRAKTGESVNFGGSYISGIYLIEVVQGTERKLLKGVKQ